jgi:hypothetical protein
MGPTLMVYIPGALTGAAVNAINEILAVTAVNVLRPHDNAWDFLPHTDPDACACSLQAVPFGTEAVGPGEFTDDDPELRAEAQKRLPFVPRTTLQLDNCCRSDLDGHRVLAGLAVSLAEYFGGLIDVDSAQEMIDAVGHTAAKPNVDCYTLEHVIHDGRIGFTYCVAPKLMTGWIGNPAFRLVI